MIMIEWIVVTEYGSEVVKAKTRRAALQKFVSIHGVDIVESIRRLFPREGYEWSKVSVRLPR